MARFFGRLGIAALLLLVVGIYLTQSGMWKDFSDASGIGNPDAQLGAPTVPRPGAGKGVVPNPFELGFDALRGAGVDLDGFYGDALATLEKVPILAAGTGKYDEAKFGKVSTDKNGCTTFEQVLIRDLTDAVVTEDDPCHPVSGTLIDPYTGEAVEYVPGGTDVEVVYVVSPENAWASGAKKWGPKKRNQFYNDPANLVAVKADTAPPAMATPDTWTPENADMKCVYVSVWTQAKHRWNLSMTPQEAEAVDGTLRDCMGVGASE